MAMRRAKQFSGAMPEEIAFAKQRATRRYQLPRVDGAFAVACLISFVLIVPPALLGWAIARSGGYADIVLALAAGAVASVVITFLTARAWLRFAPSDRLFADATISGWLRTERATRRVARAREVFDDPGVAPIELHVDRLVAIAHSLEARDARTHRHSTRVALRATSAAKQLGLDADEVARVRAAAKLHEIGALREPLPIDRGDLGRERIAKAGADLLEFTGDRELIRAIRHQNERYDGTGTPDGLSGAAIPLTARIIAVADAYDLAARERGQKTALAELDEGAGSRFDPEVVRAFEADAQSSPTTALRGALTGAFPRAAQGAAELVRGTASVAAAASIATTAVVAGGVGVEKSEHGKRSGSGAPAVVASAPAASSAGERSGGEGAASGKGGRKHSASGGEGGKVGGRGGTSDPSTGGGSHSGEGGGSSQGDSGAKSSSSSGGEGGGTTAKKSDPVKDLTDTVEQTVDNTTTTVNDTVTDVVDTVNDTVKNTTDTVDGLVGGLTGSKK